MKFKLSDLADYVTEKIDIESIDLDTYISTENMLPEKQGVSIIEKLPNVKRVTRFKKGDTLVSNIRPYFKKIWFANRDGGCSADVLVFRAKDKVKPEFLFCLLFQDYFFNRMVLSSKGTKMPRGDKKAIMETSFEITELENQEKISKIFFDFKEKIELNNQMIATLEELAATLFKQWFVDFEFPDENGNPYKSSGGKMVDSELGEIPEGWEVIKLQKLADIQNGFAFKSNDYVESTEGTIKVIRTLNIDSNNLSIDNNDLKFLPVNFEKIYPKVKLELFDTLLVMVGATIGKVGLITSRNIPSLQNQNMWRFRSIYPYLDNTLLFHYVKLCNKKAENWKSGSAREFYRKDSFKQIEVVLPKSVFLMKASSVTMKIYKIIDELLIEIDNLTETRDSLLPKLLSGELEV